MATDKQLIQQIQKGKSKAYEQLFRKYYQQIYSVCFSILKNSHDAEEVTQETFVQAYLKLDQLKDKDKFFVWLKKIAQNHSKRYAQNTDTEIIPLDLASAQTATQIAPDEGLLRQELIDSIMEAVSALPPKDREVIQARINGLSHSEISEQLDISTSASMSRLYRARKEIKARVKELLNVIIGLPNTLSLEKIISGGIVAMKIGTSTKVIIGVIGVLVAGFIGFQVVTHNKTQQVKVKPTEKVTQKTVRPKPQPKPVRKHLDESEKIIQDEQYPTEKEIESALEWLDSIGSGEKTEDIKEVASETEVSEIEEGENKISPELEEMFMKRKELSDKVVSLVEERRRLAARWGELHDRQDELSKPPWINMKDEKELYRRVSEEKEDIQSKLEHVNEQYEQIRSEYNEYFKKHYGISLKQFFINHGHAYVEWEKNQ